MLIYGRVITSDNDRLDPYRDFLAIIPVAKLLVIVPISRSICLMMRKSKSFDESENNSETSLSDIFIFWQMIVNVM